jgi:hypothetical protein
MVVEEEDGEGNFDESCEKDCSITNIQGEQEYPTDCKRRDANWIGHILPKTFIPKHIIDGNIEGRKSKKK